MERDSFDPAELQRLSNPEKELKHGMVTIIGGSELFHGAPLLSLRVASRRVDMVFFSSPDPSVGEVANLLRSQLSSFIWVPFDQVETYIEKSKAVLIGPGLMRYKKDTEAKDKAWHLTREVTKNLLTKFHNKKWVIDAGSLQVMEPEWIPEGSLITPNAKEFAKLFGNMSVEDASEKYKCTIILKGPIDRVCSNGKCCEVEGGNEGMAKGGTGDVLAGLVVALLAQNDDTELVARCASYINKLAGDKLFNEVGTNFNADDLANMVPKVLKELQKQG